MSRKVGIHNVSLEYWRAREFAKRSAVVFADCQTQIEVKRHCGAKHHSRVVVVFSSARIDKPGTDSATVIERSQRSQADYRPIVKVDNLSRTGDIDLKISNLRSIT